MTNPLPADSQFVHPQTRDYLINNIIPASLDLMVLAQKELIDKIIFFTNQVLSQSKQKMRVQKPFFLRNFELKRNRFTIDNLRVDTGKKIKNRKTEIRESDNPDLYDTIVDLHKKASTLNQIIEQKQLEMLDSRNLMTVQCEDIISKPRYKEFKREFYLPIGFFSFFTSFTLYFFLRKKGEVSNNIIKIYNKIKQTR